jgi:isopentenyl phosphate kinase
VLHQLLQLVLPVLEGRSASARAFMQELETQRKPEYAVSERRIGIDKEAWYIASTPAGDQLVAYLAPRLCLSRVGLVTDVPGVLGPDGAVVPRVSKAGVERLALGASGATDVTGGMGGKVAELLRLADAGVSSHVFGSDRLADFLAGRPHGGTVVVPEGA